MKHLNTLILLSLVLILITGCRKDEFNTNIDTTPPTPIDYYESSIEGYVIDEDNQPLSDVTITLGDNVTTTNSLGYFHIHGVGQSTHTVISASLDGYFDNFETYVPSQNQARTSQTRIKLTERLASGSFQSSVESTISIEGLNEVTFQANSIVRADGSQYDGPVIVYAHDIDPTAEDAFEVMPGNLMAINAQDEMAVLQSFGMINVELQSPSGEELNINSPATIQVDIPASLEDNAPSEIPLWYFDEDTGLWKEDGAATRQGGVYRGEVSHFTTWNVDLPFIETVIISGTIQDAQGVPAVKVFVEDVTTGLQYAFWTDDQGEFFGVVPQDVQYTIFVRAFCDFDGFLYSDDIGPFTSSVDLGIIDVSNNNEFTTVTGILVDCDLSPVPNGQVFFNYPGFSYSTDVVADANGNFSALIPTCPGDDVEIRGVDPSTGLVSGSFWIEVDESTEDIGSITLCVDISSTLGEVTYFFDGQEKTFDNCSVTIGVNDFGFTQYAFVFTEYFEDLDKSIVYYLLMSDRNSNLDAPDWSFNVPMWGPPTVDSDETYTRYLAYLYDINGNVPTVNVTQQANNTGEIMTLQVSNFRLGVTNVNESASVDFNNSSMTISAVKTN